MNKHLQMAKFLTDTNTWLDDNRKTLIDDFDLRLELARIQGRVDALIHFLEMRAESEDRK